MLDHRDLEDRAARLQSQADAIKAKAVSRALTAAEQSEVDDLELQATNFQVIAADWQRKEKAELRDIVAKGTSLTGSSLHGETRAFLDYIRTGEPLDASLSTTDGNGGYVVPEPIHQALLEKVRKVDPIVAGATMFDLAGGDTSTILPYKATHGAVANATETGARSEQNAPTFEGPTLTCYDYYTDQRATQTVLDSVTDLEDLLLGWIVEDIWEQAGVDFAVGNGSTKASGLFAATSTYATKLSGSAGALVNTAFLTVYTALHPRYRANGVWLMNSATLAVVLGYSHPAASNNQPLVEWVNGVPTILGRPVLECTSAPDIGAANYPVAFADLRQAYAIGVHRRPMIIRDVYTVTPYVRFYSVARIGGTPWDKQAAILLKSNNS